jgi:hypothetical protein
MTNDLVITKELVENTAKLITFVDQLIAMTDPAQYREDEYHIIVNRVIEDNGLEQAVEDNPYFKELLTWRACETCQMLSLVRIVAEHAPEAGYALMNGSYERVATRVTKEAIDRMMHG